MIFYYYCGHYLVTTSAFRQVPLYHNQLESVSDLTIVVEVIFKESLSSNAIVDLLMTMTRLLRQLSGLYHFRYNLTLSRVKCFLFPLPKQQKKTYTYSYHINFVPVLLYGLFVIYYLFTFLYFDYTFSFVSLFSS